MVNPRFVCGAVGVRSALASGRRFGSARGARAGVGLALAAQLILQGELRIDVDSSPASAARTRRKSAAARDVVDAHDVGAVLDAVGERRQRARETLARGAAA